MCSPGSWPCTSVEGMETSRACLMSKATGGENHKPCCAQREEMGERTWLDIADGLLGASNVATGEGFGIPLPNVLGGLLGWDVSLDDAHGDSEIGRLLCDCLRKARSLPLN